MKLTDFVHIGLIILFGGNPWAVAISFILIALIWMFSR